MVGHILQCHSAEKIHDILGKAVCIGTAACCKWDILLLVVVTFFTLTLVALHLHSDDYLLSTYRKSCKIPDSIAVLYQMALSALRTYG